MTINEIKELLELFQQSGVGEMEVQRGENRLRLSRGAAPLEVRPPAASSPPAGPAPGDEPGVMLPAVLPARPGQTAPSAAPEAESASITVTSPIVGTFYEASEPGSPPFVRVGDRIEPGQVLCIIESMKLMNEIEAEVSGVITAKLAENGRAVEYGEPLFTVQPA